MSKTFKGGISAMVAVLLAASLLVTGCATKGGSGTPPAPDKQAVGGSGIPLAPVKTSKTTEEPTLPEEKPVVVTTLAEGTRGYADGIGAAAKFDRPESIAVDSVGNVYVVDHNNHRVRKISPEGVVTTLAGSTAGYADGTGAAAKFYWPNGVALDSAGNVYVGDAGNHRIRKITLEGAVTTFAGSSEGYADGTGAAAKFNQLQGVAVDSVGNFYVADSRNNRIRKISPEGVVTTLAGSIEGYADGTGTEAKFGFPRSVAVDGTGNVYVTDWNNGRIRKITPEGAVTTLAGEFSQPRAVAVDSVGNVYVADWNNSIYKITISAP